MWYNLDGSPPRWYAVGIVSFGLSQCAQANIAGVYTRFVFSNNSFTEITNNIFHFLGLTNISIGY